MEGRINHDNLKSLNTIIPLSVDRAVYVPLAQNYIGNKSAGKDELEAYATKIQGDRLAIIPEIINKVKIELSETVLSFDELEEIQKTIDKKKKGERHKDDTYKAERELRLKYPIIKNLPYLIADLAIPASILAITSVEKKTVPTYKQAFKMAVAQSEAYIKQIYQETGLSQEANAKWAYGLIRDLCDFLYIIYHPKEWDSFTAYLREHAETESKIILDSPVNEDKLRELERKHFEKLDEFALKIEGRKDIEQIVSKIIKSIYNIKIDLSTLRKENEYTDFFKLSQNAVTNNLSRTMGIKTIKEDRYGKAEIQGKDIRVFIEEYNQLTSGVSQRVVQLLDYLIIGITEKGGYYNPEIEIPLKTYMKDRGLRDEKETKKAINEDLNILAKISLSYRYKQDWFDVFIFGGNKGVKDGVITFKFNDTFLKLLPEKQFMYLPKILFNKDIFNLKLNPLCYPLGRRLSEHFRMNKGRPQENIIGVDTLINACPSLPKYTDIKNKGQLQQRIQDPFERDMTKLADHIPGLQWEYEAEQPLTYQEFINAKIRIVWHEYPDLSEVRKRQIKYKKRISNYKKQKN